MKYIRFAEKRIFYDAHKKVIANDSNRILVIVHDFLENQGLVQSVQLF